MKRANRVRSKIVGTAERPRLSVFRSNKNIFAQIVDDRKGVTLVSASTLDKGFRKKPGEAFNRQTAEEVGKRFGVTRERIRQIEAKALRKLRHPSRSRKLRDFLE